MAKMQFAAFNDESINKTCAAWSGDAKKGLGFPSEVEQTILWARSHMKIVEGDSAAFGIFEDGDPVALGICEVVVSRKSVKSIWVKFLQLKFRPVLDDKLYNNDTAALKEAIEIFAAGVVGVMALKMTHKATTLKVFGRTKPQLNFLQQVVVTLHKISDRYHIAIEGRFLVIANKEK